MDRLAFSTNHLADTNNTDRNYSQKVQENPKELCKKTTRY